MVSGMDSSHMGRSCQYRTAGKKKAESEDVISRCGERELGSPEPGSKHWRGLAISGITNRSPYRRNGRPRYAGKLFRGEKGDLRVEGISLAEML